MLTLGTVHCAVLEQLVTPVATTLTIHAPFVAVKVTVVPTATPVILLLAVLIVPLVVLKLPNPSHE